MEHVTINNPQYSNRELDHYFLELNKRLDTQDKSLEKITAQTTITNGRVNKLDDWSIEAKAIIENSMKTLNEYKADKVKILTVIAVITLLGGGIVALSIYAINSKIQQGITDALANYDIQVDNITN